MSEPAVYVIHENPEWFAPLAEAFAAEGVPLREWLLTGGTLDLASPPPEGVFWSRLSASAHTRGNGHAKEYGRAVLHWLEQHGRRVVNGSATLEVEVSKVRQHTLLSRAGFDVPRTVAALGQESLTVAAASFPAPFIVKHNQGGKGLSVRRFDTHEEFDAWVTTEAADEAPVDGITLVQEYLLSREPFVTRAEFVGGRFVYAVRVDTSAGAFELCPVGPGGALEAAPAFSLRADVDLLLIARYEEFLAATGIEIAGIEFLETVDGRVVTYDVNTNTNYNPAVEADAASPALAEIARFFAAALQAETALV